MRRVVHRQHLAHADDLDGRTGPRRTVEQWHKQVNNKFTLLRKIVERMNANFLFYESVHIFYEGVHKMDAHLLVTVNKIFLILNQFACAHCPVLLICVNDKRVTKKHSPSCIKKQMLTLMPMKDCRSQKPALLLTGQAALRPSLRSQ